jgi:glycogen debranching enzyme
VRSQESYEHSLAKAFSAIRKARGRDCQIHTSNEQFNDWLNRSSADLHMLISKTPEGLYPYAGVPWFSTPFGRDGIITALQSLWVNPEIAKGVLAYLAAAQAKKVNAEQEAEPGKILHEIRKGEMARCGEIAFEKYYGTADATPLFVMLAGAYYKRTGDDDFIETIWGNIEKALGWIESYGDMDGDGFVEYAQHSAKGLVQQGWKDSNDSIFHADGSLAKGPIALCEVQGYVYEAWRNAAELAKIKGKTRMAEDLGRRAEELKERFNRAFWCEEISTYAIALDGDKRQCRVRSSNAGHALFTGIAAPEYAQQVGKTLLDENSFSGWGVRTIAKAEANYNPMAYHNGSVWPHDNALIAMGLSRYGFKSKAMEIMTGLFDASIVLDLHRLPELFCGFPRRPGQGPTQYPVACMPQAWAATTVFFFLQACLGLSFERKNNKLCFSHPQLPDYLEWLEIRNLSVNHGTVDLRLRRHAQDVSINVLRKEGDVEITVIV